MRNRVLSVVLLCLLLSCIFVLLISCELMYEAKNGKAEIKKVNILVYGNDYSDCMWNTSSVNKLYGTVNDATQVGLALEALAQKAGFECSSYYILGKNSDETGQDFAEKIPNAISASSGKLDTNTTKNNLREKISSFASSSTDEDLTFIFVSCHGWYDLEKGEKSDYAQASCTYFVTSANTGDTCELYSHDDFLSDIKTIKGIKVVLSDSCYSGGFVKPGYVSVNNAEYSNIDSKILFFENEEIDIDSSLYCLSASRYYEESFEIKPERTHGHFTAALLESLGWDGEKLTTPKALKGGFLTFQNIANYIVNNDGNSEQNPMFSDGSNDVILFSLE